MPCVSFFPNLLLSLLTKIPKTLLSSICCSCSLQCFNAHLESFFFVTVKLLTITSFTRRVLNKSGLWVELHFSLRIYLCTLEQAYLLCGIQTCILHYQFLYSTSSFRSGDLCSPYLKNVDKFNWTISTLYRNFWRTASQWTPKQNHEQQPSVKVEKNNSDVVSVSRKRQRKLLQVKVTHPDISTTSPSLDLHVKQFIYEKLNMPNREINDQIYVAKMPQPNSVMITLSHHRSKVFLFQAKKQLRINNAQVYRKLFIYENLISLNYFLFKKLKSKKTTQWKLLAKFWGGLHISRKSFC